MSWVLAFMLAWVLWHPAPCACGPDGKPQGACECGWEARVATPADTLNDAWGMYRDARAKKAAQDYMGAVRELHLVVNQVYRLVGDHEEMDRGAFDEKGAPRVDFSARFLLGDTAYTLGNMGLYERELEELFGLSRCERLATGYNYLREAMHQFEQGGFEHDVMWKLSKARLHSGLRYLNRHDCPIPPATVMIPPPP